MGYTRCPTTCDSTDMDPASCACAIPDEYLSTYGALSILQTAGIYDLIKAKLHDSSDETLTKVLRVLEDMAREGMTMLLVTHEMSFARRVAHRVVFMNQGRVWEQGPSSEFFAAPKTEELKSFLSSVLH